MSSTLNNLNQKMLELQKEQNPSENKIEEIRSLALKASLETSDIGLLVSVGNEISRICEEN